MVAANRTGAAQLLLGLAEEVGLEAVVHRNDASSSQEAAAAAKVARELRRLPEGRVRFEERRFDDAHADLRDADDRARPRRGLTPPSGADLEAVGGAAGPSARLTIDFEGHRPRVSAGNLNAPVAVVQRGGASTCLRSLVAERIPLERGLSRSGRGDGSRKARCSIRLAALRRGRGQRRNLAAGRRRAARGARPRGCEPGDHEQRDLRRRLRSATTRPWAAAPARRPIARPGASGVHTHMTNTRITDPEILEARFPGRA